MSISILCACGYVKDWVFGKDMARMQLTGAVGPSPKRHWMLRNTLLSEVVTCLSGLNNLARDINFINFKIITISS